ncbi:MAG: c-type cytochrome [Limnobacter sp.]|uniref:c-type cytochrome n=1 Tax=Limnobacter sp. TaxID=2003368 RepID=UPI00391C2956
MFLTPLTRGRQAMAAALLGLLMAQGPAQADDQKKQTTQPGTTKSSTPTSNTAPALPATGGVNGRLLASNCFQCHGTDGSGGFEKLRGESEAEIYSELKEFASGKEHPNSIMAAHATGFTDAQMRLIAKYFASLK